MHSCNLLPVSVGSAEDGNGACISDMPFGTKVPVQSGTEVRTRTDVLYGLHSAESRQGGICPYLGACIAVRNAQNRHDARGTINDRRSGTIFAWSN